MFEFVFLGFTFLLQTSYEGLFRSTVQVFLCLVPDIYELKFTGGSNLFDIEVKS